MKSVHKTVGIEVYYQVGNESDYDNAVLHLFCHFVSEPCFNVLRTKEQLGYIVQSSDRTSNGVNGLVYLV